MILKVDTAFAGILDPLNTTDVLTAVITTLFNAGHLITNTLAPFRDPTKKAPDSAIDSAM